ncbi:MAG TPA: HAMP domain-containing sensor histidine kinase [Solirubrobacterales bacterium]|jgi:signal transduction histidine kinase|nr:HAMP domain-containing sensor histidine kinase [Solirubrobacterales bacterium]
MALVLGATGVFIYLRYASELNMTIDAGLKSRATDVASLVRDSDSGLRPSQGLVEGLESFAVVLDGKGRLEDSSLPRGGGFRLSPEQLARARRGPVFIEGALAPASGNRAKLLAVPVGGERRGRVVVVGTATEARDEALTDLQQLLLIGGPVALLLASLAAYGVAALALKPVEAMRSRAAAISAAEPDQRLPVPPTGDEIARLGTTLNEMLERLGEALAHERAFVADASHELRTPLAILRTELELALAKGRSPEELRAALASAAEETDRLTQLSEDLLTIAQTERGELPLRLARVDLGEALAGVERRFAGRAAERGRRLEVSAPAGLALDADRLRLDQAIGSIVDNALRYGDGEVELVAREENGWAEIHVLDRGAGFTDEFLGRAFERFSRASSSDRDGGSGLGLAIVRTVARAHGGEAHAGNREGGGADVWLTLPPLSAGGRPVSSLV